VVKRRDPAGRQVLDRGQQDLGVALPFVDPDPGIRASTSPVLPWRAQAALTARMRQSWSSNAVWSGRFSIDRLSARIWERAPANEGAVSRKPSGTGGPSRSKYRVRVLASLAASPKGLP
jgi:hypothetical protein